MQINSYIMNILITGSAGFIGFFLTQALVGQGHCVTGIDSLNDYYDVRLKESRLRDCGIIPLGYGREIRSVTLDNYTFYQLNLCDKPALQQLFEQKRFDCVVNLAAQAGVRYSLENPDAYIESNITGFMNVLEACRAYKCRTLVYASSSSVYGNSIDVPFKESAPVDYPISVYAATKKSNELMAYTYSHLYGIQTIGLRFFTVYGPSGRPDMAPMLFANAIRRDETIKIFNNGLLARDFTYVDDIVEGVVKIVSQAQLARQDVPGVPSVVYNIGHGSPMKLMDFIRILEKYMGKTAIKEYVGMQPGDVYQTWADTTKLAQDFKYTPTTGLDEGVRRFVTWFNEHSYVIK